MSKLLKQLNLYLDKIDSLDEKYDEPERTRQIEDHIRKAADSLQTRIGDLKDLQLIVQSEELTALREKDKLETSTLERFSTSYKIIDMAIKRRKDSHRKANFIYDKNILDHGVFFAGKNKSNEAKIIRLDKNGYRQLTYFNDLGKLLSLFDTKVFMGLHSLRERNGSKKDFSFTCKELLEAVNLGKTGKHYQLLKDSLKTLYATSVIMKEYYNVGEQRRVEVNQFRLLQSSTFDAIIKEDNEEEPEKYHVQFSDPLYESLTAGYIRHISLAMLEDLQSETAQALYLMMISVPLHPDGYLEMQVDQICSHIGISPNRPQKKIDILSKACEELINTEILENRIFHNNDKLSYLRLYPTEWFKSSLRNAPSFDLDSSDREHFLL